jgi:predicted transcriptional regulator
MTAPITAAQRFTPDHPCPICGGHHRLPQGQGRRCWGFLSSDGAYAHCTREECAGALQQASDGTFAHKLVGPCHCGQTHTEDHASSNGRQDSAIPRASVVVTYDYRDETGALQYQVVRKEPKGFAQRRPDGSEWIWNLTGVLRLPYRLPELLAADRAAWIFVTEGEKDADSLIALGLVATCNSEGAGNWQPELNQWFLGRRVCILPDNDQAGEVHAEVVSRNLTGIAREVKVGRLPDLPEKGDVSDWLAAGGQVEDLFRLFHLVRARSVIPADDPAWPTMADEAFHGLFGEIAEIVGPETEASREALVLICLLLFGNAIGRGPHVMIGSRRHAANEYLLLAGPTSIGRKGQAQSEAERVFAGVDRLWLPGRHRVGIASGEGLIDEVAEPKPDEDDDAPPKPVDPRLLVVEQELSSVLRKSRREGSIISSTLRTMWDGDPVATMGRVRPARAERHHLTLIGHITEEELAAELNDLAIANGLGNRFLMGLVRRSKQLPRGGRLSPDAITLLQDHVTQCVRASFGTGEVMLSDEAGHLWDALYPDIPLAEPGMVSAICARAEAHIRRLALIYTVADGTTITTTQHLGAAVATWSFTEDSARRLFQRRSGDAVADRIHETLLDEGPLDKSDLSAIFSRNINAGRLDAAIRSLLVGGRVLDRKENTRGRPRHVYTAVEPRDSTVAGDHRLVRRLRELTANEKSKTNEKRPLRSEFPF